MKTLFKTAAIAALITGFANSASALEVLNPIEVPGTTVSLFEGAVFEPTEVATRPQFAKIGVARIDGGRLIPTPFGEEYDWQLLDRRMDTKVELMSAGDYLKYIPEIAFQGLDTDNKIDEIRLTAANEGYSHVLIYGIGPDATWASFGGKSLRETGLTVHTDCASWDKARAKALLIDSYTGEVLGAAKADNITYHIGELADDVERLVKTLT